jgi:putative transposase
MPRSARIVVPGIAHHVTQRGNRRMQTFFSDADYARYLELMSAACAKFDVGVVAYCLMPNHAHLVLVPQTAGGLREALKSAHQKYAWIINRRQGWTGHLWQERFYSYALDDAHLASAIRYVELNPLRARLVARAEDWRWSSAASRIVGDSRCAVPLLELPTPMDRIADWSAFLMEGLRPDEVDVLRRHGVTGRPLGSIAFLRQLEVKTGQRVVPRMRGRPRRDENRENRGRHCVSESLLP